METKNITLLEANTTNIENTFKKIQQFVTDNNYRLEGELKMPTNFIGLNKSLKFESKRQMKVVRNYINRLEKKVNISTANKFLHFLFKKIYKLEKSPKILLSEKEFKIQDARKAWKYAAAEAEKLRVAYRKEKGDFYKPKNTVNLA